MRCLFFDALQYVLLFCVEEYFNIKMSDASPRPRQVSPEYRRRAVYAQLATRPMPMSRMLHPPQCAPRPLAQVNSRLCNPCPHAAPPVSATISPCFESVEGRHVRLDTSIIVTAPSFWHQALIPPLWCLAGSQSLPRDSYDFLKYPILRCKTSMYDLHPNLLLLCTELNSAHFS